MSASEPLGVAASLPSWKAWRAEEALSPYEPSRGHGPWDASLAAHLYRRAVGGPRPGQAQAAGAEDGPGPLLARCFAPKDDARLALERRWARYGASLAQGERSPWAAGWLMKLLAEDRAPGMRLTLFWHGHFANALSKVRELPWLEAQQQTFLRLGEGPFLALASAMLRDPAMLRFLDGDANRRGLPNENLAREFLELFTLGVGPYTEHDVQEAARALTGRTVRRGAYWEEPLHHDPRPKEVLAQPLDDGDQLAAIAVAHPACPRFLIRRLWAFYVAPTMPDGVEETLAERWRERALDLSWLLRTMLSSRAFFAREAVAALVASPVDLVVKTMRALGARPQLEALEVAATAMGQELGEPPGVQGWAGGEAWIHTAAWLERTRFAEDVAHGRHDFLREASWEDLDWQELLPLPLSRERAASLQAQLQDQGAARRERLYATLSLPEYHLY